MLGNYAILAHAQNVLHPVYVEGSEIDKFQFSERQYLSSTAAHAHFEQN